MLPLPRVALAYSDSLWAFGFMWALMGLNVLWLRPLCTWEEEEKWVCQLSEYSKYFKEKGGRMKEEGKGQHIHMAQRLGTINTNKTAEICYELTAIVWRRNGWGGEIKNTKKKGMKNAIGLLTRSCWQIRTWLVLFSVMGQGFSVEWNKEKKARIMQKEMESQKTWCLGYQMPWGSNNHTEKRRKKQWLRVEN